MLAWLKSSRSTEPILVFIVLVVAFLLLLGSTLGVGFQLIDDHEILSFYLPESQAALQANPTQFISDYLFQPGVGRWRPIYRLVRFIETSILGTNPLLWRIVVMAMGIVTLVALYFALRQLGISVYLAAFCLVNLVLFQAAINIWFELGPAELLAMLLTTLALYVLVRAAQQPTFNRWDGALILLLILAANTKESFILTIPAFVLMRWTLDCWYHKQNWLEVLAKLWAYFALLMVIFSVALGYVFLFIARDGYGFTASGVLSQPFSPLRWVFQAVIVAPSIGSYLPLVFILLFLIRPKSGSRKYKNSAIYGLVGLFTLAVWVMPQFILNSKTFYGRYLFPAILGTTVTVTICLAVLLKNGSRNQKRVYLIGMLILSYLAVFNLAELNRNVSMFTSQTQALSDTIQTVIAKSDPNRAVVVVSNLNQDYEATYSMWVSLKFYGLKSKIYYQTLEMTHVDIPDSYLTHFDGLADNLDAKDVTAAIWLNLNDHFPFQVPAWFANNQWDKTDFAEPVYLMGGLIKLIQVDKVGYRVDFSR